jgi:ATP-dependent DNA ligase
VPGSSASATAQQSSDIGATATPWRSRLRLYRFRRSNRVVLRCVRLPERTLAKPAALATDRAWWFEPKWDGSRAIVRGGAHNCVRSRRGRQVVGALLAQSRGYSCRRSDSIQDCADVLGSSVSRPDFASSTDVGRDSEESRSYAQGPAELARGGLTRRARPPPGRLRRSPAG